MKRPEINGWEVTTNENGIKMATLPRDTMEEIVKFVEYADKQLRLGAVSQQRELLIAYENKVGHSSKLDAEIFVDKYLKNVGN